jgi:hypothetical protein
MSTARRKLGPITLDVPALFIGVQILAKGWEKLAHFDQHPFAVWFLFLLGGVVVSGSLLTLWLERRLESSHGLFHVAEGVAIVLSAIVMIEDGRLRMPLVLLFAGLAYVASGAFESLPRSRRECYVGLFQRAFGVAFLVASLALAGATILHDGDAWALGAAGVIASVGLVFLLLPKGFVRARATREGQALAPNPNDVPPAC